MHLGTIRAEGSPDQLKAEIGPEATLEDVFRHHTGSALGGAEEAKGGCVRSARTRRTAARVR